MVALGCNVRERVRSSKERSENGLALFSLKSQMKSLLLKVSVCVAGDAQHAAAPTRCQIFESNDNEIHALSCDM